MMKKSWRTGALAVGAVGALALSSCGFSGGSGDSNTSSAAGDGASSGAAAENVSLNMLVPTYSDTKTSVDGVGTKARWEKVVADFQAKNPNIKITLQVESWENLETVLKTKIQGDQAPDIYNGGAISGFVADDLLAKADEITSPETLANFQDTFNDNEKVGGTQYGLPLLASDRALFYNKTLLKEAGISEVPKTWDELLSAAKAIKEKTGNPGYGMPLGSEEAQAEAMLWSLGAGGNFGNESEITIDTPQNLEAFNEMKTFIDAGVTQSNPGSTQRTPMMSGFVQGKMGFVYALPPTVAQIKKENPDLDYGIAQPATKDGSAVTLGVADRLASFSKDQAKKDAVKKFMDYFFSDDVYVPFIKGESFLPTTKTGAEAMSSDETLKPFLDLLPNAKFYPTTNPAWAATDGALKSLTGGIEKNPAEDVLKQIQAKADAAS
jgi:multiple sugar transport system substrate-binding protein